MLPRIKTKTNLIVPCFKNATLTYPDGLFTLKEHLVESKCMLFYMCLTYSPLFLVFQSYEKRENGTFRNIQ